MRRVVLWVGLTAGAMAPLAAQDSTALLLQQAQTFYQQLDIERAVPLLRQLLSPAWTDPVTPDQRVAAYKYLGAALVLTGDRDSAVLAFRAALERDAFTDLDPTVFTPAQLMVFGQARTQIFAVGVRPVAATRLDPRTERVTFSAVTTHAATLDVALAGPGGTTAAGSVLFSGVSGGLRQLTWNGLLDDGRLAAPGRYALIVRGRSDLLDTSDSARVYFDVTQETEPLEDTLPDLAARDLLAEQRPAGAATADLVKGFAVAATALLLADRLASGELGGGMRSGSRLVAGAGAATGVVAFIRGRRHRELPANIAANAQRRTERLAANAAIARRNTDRLAGTVLVITPAAGVGP